MQDVTAHDLEQGEDGVLKEHFKGINRGRLLAHSAAETGISENVVFLTAFNLLHWSVQQ